MSIRHSTVIWTGLICLITAACKIGPAASFQGPMMKELMKPNENDYARGVPYPDFGWDPLTYDAPVTRATSSLPSSVSAGEVILYTGTGSGTVTFDCEATAPCMLKGQGQTLTSPLGVTGSHFVVENLSFFNGEGSVGIGGTAAVRASFVVIRGIVHSGDNTGTSNGTSMLVRFAHDVVYYKNKIHNIRELSGASEIDYIGFVPRHEVDRVWYLDNDVSEVGGDAIRTGTNVRRLRQGLQPPLRIYIARNRFHGMGENPIDLKYSTDIVVSTNELYGVSVVSSSQGEGAVLHERADRVAFLDNHIHDVNRGIVTATSGGGAKYVLVDGNMFENIKEYGVYNRGGGHADITNNIFRNVSTAVRTNSNNGSTTSNKGNKYD